VFAAFAERGDVLPDFVGAGGAFKEFDDGEAPALECGAEVGERREGAGGGDLAEAVEDDFEFARGALGGVEQFERAGGEVAGVRVGRGAGGFEGGVDAGELGVGHVNLAADFDAVGERRGEFAGDGGDGGDVAGDVVADGAVRAAREGAGEAAVFVEERDGDAVYFRFNDEGFSRCGAGAGGGGFEVGNGAGGEGGEFAAGVAFFDAQHRGTVGGFGKALGMVVGEGLGSVGGGVGEGGVGGEEGVALAGEAVVFGVGDFGAALLIEGVVAGDFGAGGGGAGGGGGGGRRRRPI